MNSDELFYMDKETENLIGQKDKLIEEAVRVQGKIYSINKEIECLEEEKIREKLKKHYVKVVCLYCKGSGILNSYRRGEDGYVNIVCDRCKGDGYLWMRSYDEGPVYDSYDLEFDERCKKHLKECCV